MPYAQWDSSLETGDELVDAQHKNLYAIVNELHEAIIDERAKEAVALVLVRILLHAKTHFHDEELLMARSNFPDIERHKELHREFEQEAERLSDEYLAGTIVSPLGLSEFLHAWLIEHIGSEDRLLAEHVQQQRLKDLGS